MKDDIGCCYLKYADQPTRFPIFLYYNQFQVGIFKEARSDTSRMVSQLDVADVIAENGGFSRKKYSKNSSHKSVMKSAICRKNNINYAIFRYL